MKGKPSSALIVLFCFSLLYLTQDRIFVLYQTVLQWLVLFLGQGSAESVNCDEICSLRLIVFLALMVATPQLNLSRRLLMTLVGLLLLVLIDLASVFIWSDPVPLIAAANEAFFRLCVGFLWALLKHLLLPVLLWVILVDRHIGLLFPDSAFKGGFAGR